MKTKSRTKHILDKHKNTSKMRLSAKVFDRKDKNHEFDVDVVRDSSGWFTKTTLKASKRGPWVKDRQGTKVLEIRDYDCTLTVTFPAWGKRTEDLAFMLDYCDLCDLVTAFTASEHMIYKTTGRRGKTKLSLGKIRQKRVK